MNKEFLSIWLKAGILRKKQSDFEKIKSLINSAEMNMAVVKFISITY